MQIFHIFKRYPYVSLIHIRLTLDFKFFICTHSFVFIIGKMIVPDFYEQMSQTYPSIHYWPQPYSYMQWFQSLDAQYQPYYMHPEIYNLNYEFSIRKYQQLIKPAKLSRCKKRAEKKKKLQEELQRERKQIGKWVNLERKDLIQGIERIDQKERKIREKRRSKYSHLIEIHKEVYKHYVKKGNSEAPNRRVNIKTKKKRLTYIKRMKLAFEKCVNKAEIDNYESDWESQEQAETEANKDGELIKEKKKKKQENAQINISQQLLEKIKYMQMGKLTGKDYQSVMLRQWVRNVPSQKLQDLALRIINRLAYKQAVRKVQKPTKAKKLIVSGIKQCKRTIQTIIDKNRSKMLIVALNIQRNPFKNGVDDEVQSTIQHALNINIPVVHISTRSKLGRAFTGKFGPRITMVSIINFEGYQDMMELLVNEWKDACKAYDAL